MRSDAKRLAPEDGSCAVVLVLTATNAWVINLGDCRAVLARVQKPKAPAAAAAAAATSTSASASSLAASAASVASAGTPSAERLQLVGHQLTKDHTPALLSERQRVEAAGAAVEQGRVAGLLGVTRSFGDLGSDGGEGRRGKAGQREGGTVVALALRFVSTRVLLP